MKLKSARLIPVYLSSVVVGLACLLQILPRWVPSFDLFQRLEWMTYDWRVRQSIKYSGTVATNLGAVFIDDHSLELINTGLSFRWPWPRQLHGRLVQKLHQQGARAVGFDILFQEMHARSPRTDVQLSNGGSIGSDDYLARQLRQASNVVLATFGETLGDRWTAIPPADQFRTNAVAIGHATSLLDSDGVLRRARAFRDDPRLGRIWHLGLRIAAMDLGIDLDKAIVNEEEIILRTQDGDQRVIPIGEDASFYINWSLTWNDMRIAKTSFQKAAGFLPPPETPEVGAQAWDPQGLLLFVGSIGSGNNISDVGTTPLARETYLVSKHWNVANSLLTGQFITRSSGWVDVLLILVLGMFSYMVTMRFSTPWPTLLIILTSVVYVITAASLFIAERYWLPIVMPVLGGLLLTHGGLVTYQALFEQKAKRHVQRVFSKLVSPDVVHELLAAEKLNLGGARHHITVLFTDVRGFTQMTDTSQQQAEAYIREHNLSGEQAKAHLDENARLTLATVNDYLALIADQVKIHQGTLDKYIGDCVMAFWGAPTPNEKHALCCVRAAIDAQRAIYQLNVERAGENKEREARNKTREANGEQPLPMLPLLTLGTGINTGNAIVGLMGSQDHILNYTVFGQDVNLASRLQDVSGRGRIIISSSTYADLQRDDPALAKQCVKQPDVTVKGIREPVENYEVPWKEE